MKLSIDEENLLKRLTLGKKNVRTLSESGVHRSADSGNDIEFKEYKAYNAGDDLRQLDWKVLAKTEKYYIKNYSEDKNISGYILLDISASMATPFPGDVKLAKLTTAIKNAFYLSRLYYYNKESLGLITFTDKIQKVILSSLSSKTYNQIFNEIDRLLENTEELSNNIENSKLSHQNVFGEMQKIIGSKKEVFVFSDFYEDTEVVLRHMKLLSKKKNNVNVFHFLDSNEMSIKSQDFLNSVLVDSETKDKKKNISVKEYESVYKNHYKQLKSLCHRYQMPYFQVSTSFGTFHHFYTFIKSLV